MGEVNDIAVVAIINDILKYDVSLMFTKIENKYHVTLTWLGKFSNGSTGMGIVSGCDAKLYYALSDAYRDMTGKK